MEKMRIAVFGDVHANASAMAAVLKVAAHASFDRLVFLGDLFTYGCRPLQVADLLGDAVARHGAELISGNHEQLYFDLEAGRTSYVSKLPAWLRESVLWTAEVAQGCGLSSRFHWQECVTIGALHFAHANPYAYGNWTYLNSAEEFGAAQTALPRDVRLGVFGHTHRSKITYPAVDGLSVREIDAAAPRSFTIDPARGSTLITLGAVGQPRGVKAAQLLLITVGSGGIDVEFVMVPYDVDEHCRTISESTLSVDCKATLLGYF